MTDFRKIVQIVQEGDDAEPVRLAETIAGGDISRSDLREAMSSYEVRRWVRNHLIPLVDGAERVELAELVLDWPDDFDPAKRDRTTSAFVRSIPDQSLKRSYVFLAGSNAADALWERIAESDEIDIMDAARTILRHDNAMLRETVLHMLVLDPYGPQPLERPQQNELLEIALEDDDIEIRGLAAEVIASDAPATLLRRESAPVDASERLRMAYWQVALAYQRDEAVERAGRLILDDTQPLEARRTALLALGEGVPTRTIAPVLQVLLTGESQILADDAAQLMWRHHRAPDIADAASRSGFDSVRELAERLLHPERGSPAAGGSRPGDPTRTAEIFDQLGKDFRRDETNGHS